MKPSEQWSLNPCFNGIWSRTMRKSLKSILLCLNPCFNGIWSRTAAEFGSNVSPYVQVLILVLMEYGLGHSERDERRNTPLS